MEKNLEEIRKVENLVEDLRGPYAIVESDRPSVVYAREAYEKLSKAGKDGFDPAFLEKLIQCEKKLDPEPEKRVVYVTDPAYGAVGDGVTCDRVSIQKAIDDVAVTGGGRVVFPAGKTFLSGNLLLRSHVHLFFEDGAVLLQSADGADFVDPLHGFTPREPRYGQYVDSNIEWDATAYYNYPFVFAPAGSRDVSISGHGTIRLTGGNDPRGLLTMMAVGFVETDGYVMRDFKVIGYQAYCLKAVSCSNGLYYHLNIDASESVKGGTDGINLCNCRNIRVTSNHLLTGDDGIYVSSAYKDPREGLYFTNEHPQTPENIEVDHNHCEVTWDATKSFCFIVWSSQHPDQEKIQVNNIYIHDNYFQTLGAWTGNWNLETHLFDFNGSTNPMKNIRFENNTIGTIQDNFFTLQVSDMVGFDSMREIKNGDFEKGSIYWISRLKGSRASAGVGKDPVGQTGRGYGYIKDLELGDAALYEGIHLEADTRYRIRAVVKTSGDPVLIFVRDQMSDALVACQTVTYTKWQEISLEFSVSKSGNYRLGIERGEADKGFAYLDSFALDLA